MAKDIPFNDFETLREGECGEAGQFSEDHLVILLALFQGGPYISEQLESLAGQSHSNWSLLVSDDGSTDHGPTIVREFLTRYPSRSVSTLTGPGVGFAGNFLHLLRAVDTGAPFVSFCDQDDIWLPKKTERALRALRSVDPDIPTLYLGRTVHCGSDMSHRRTSPHFRRTPSFRNALLQNIGGGNTMVLNNAALRLAKEAAQRTITPVSHDWWMYQIVTGAGGRILYETRPGVLYRQHAGNAVGGNGGARARLRRGFAVLSGRYRTWNEINAVALNSARHLLTPENRRTLDGFKSFRRAHPTRRTRHIRDLGLYRQSRWGTIAAHVAALIGRL